MPLVIMNVAPTVPTRLPASRIEVSRRQRHEQRAGAESQAAGGNRHAGGQAVGDHPRRNVGENARQRLRREDQPKLGEAEPKLVADHHEQGAGGGGHDEPSPPGRRTS